MFLSGQQLADRAGFRSRSYAKGCPERAKRQATFPVETCQALGLKPGDLIELEAREEAGEQVWWTA